MSEKSKVVVTIDNYQELALKTKKHMADMKLPMNLITEKPMIIGKDTSKHYGTILDKVHMALGIIGEVGEFQKAIAKNDNVNIVEEGGDMLWFVAVTCADNNLEFKKIAETALDSLDLEDGHNMNDYDAFGFVDYIKKYAIYNDGIFGTKGYVDQEDFEMGLIPYLTNIVRTVVNQTYWRGTKGYDFETILQINIDKLIKRFGEKFSQYLANNRDLGGEREILETVGQ